MADTKQVKFGDRLITVPADTTPQELDAILQPKGSGFENLRTSSPNSIEPLHTPAKDASYLGKVGANVAPLVGSAWGPGGTMIGTGIKQILKASFPAVFGEPTDNVPLEGAKDLLYNNVIPKGIEGTVGLLSKGARALPASGLFKNFPATREGAAKEMTSQILGGFQQPESQILENASEKSAHKLIDMQGAVKDAGMNFNPDAKQAAMQDLENTFGKNQVGQKLVDLHKQLVAGADVAGSQTYQQISKMALSDLTHVRNWKLAAGEEGIEDLAVNKLLQSGAGKEGQLDSMKILSELTGKNKEIYGEAIRPETMSNFKDLINEIHSQQAGHSVSDSVVRYSKGRLVWASGLAGGIHSIMGLPGATAAGITLTNSTLARVMSNPETARIVVEAMRTPAMSPKGQIINSVLGNLWKGTVAATNVPEE